MPLPELSKYRSDREEKKNYQALGWRLGSAEEENRHGSPLFIGKGGTVAVP